MTHEEFMRRHHECRQKCETHYKTSDLPDPVREDIWSCACGGTNDLKVIFFKYRSYADIALLAFKAGESAVMSDVADILAVSSSNHMVANGIVEMVQSWRTE